MVFSAKNTPKQRLWLSSRGEKRRGKKKEQTTRRATWPYLPVCGDY